MKELFIFIISVYAVFSGYLSIYLTRGRVTLPNVLISGFGGTFIGCVIGYYVLPLYQFSAIDGQVIAITAVALLPFSIGVARFVDIGD